MSKPIVIPPKKKVAFVCSGGAVKATCFHLGVALALQEKGFHFRGGIKNEEKDSEDSVKQSLEISTYVGSSAGSVVATLLASGFSLKNIFYSFLNKHPKDGPRLKRFDIRSLLSLNRPGDIFNASPITGLLKILKEKNPRAIFNQPLLLNFKGLFNTNGIEKYVRNHIVPSNRFDMLDSDLFCVATQLNNSKKVIFSRFSYPSPPDDPTVHYINNVTISDAVAASTALPPIYVPYGIKNQNGNEIFYFDGEIRDTLSTHIAVDNGCDLVISSYTHQPYKYTQEIGSLTNHGLSSIMIQAIYLLVEKKINSHIYRRKQHAATLDAVNQFCKENFFDEKLRIKLLDLLEIKLNYKKNVDYIYIHPKPDDHQMFFGNHFNLMPKKMSETVQTGYRNALETLSQYEFSI